MNPLLRSPPPPLPSASSCWARAKVMPLKFGLILCATSSIEWGRGSRVPSAISIATCPVIPPVMADGDGADSQLWNVSEWDHFEEGI